MSRPCSAINSVVKRGLLAAPISPNRICPGTSSAPPLNACDIQVAVDGAGGSWGLLTVFVLVSSAEDTRFELVRA
jgi:hypothetical protein